MEEKMEAFVENTEKKILEIGKSYQKGIEDLSERLQMEKRELLLTDNHLMGKVLGLEKMEEKILQVSVKVSEIEKSCNVAIDDVSDRLQVEKNKLLLMNNHLLAEVLDLQKRDLETFEKIANVESQVQAKTDQLQVCAIKLLNILNFGRTGRI